MRSYIVDTLVIFGDARPSMNGTPQQGTLCVSLTCAIGVSYPNARRTKSIFVLFCWALRWRSGVAYLFNAYDDPQYVVFRPVLDGPFLIGLTYLPTYLILISQSHARSISPSSWS